MGRRVNDERQGNEVKTLVRLGSCDKKTILTVTCKTRQVKHEVKGQVRIRRDHRAKATQVHEGLGSSAQDSGQMWCGPKWTSLYLVFLR